MIKSCEEWEKIWVATFKKLNQTTHDTGTWGRILAT